MAHTVKVMYGKEAKAEARAEQPGDARRRELLEETAMQMIALLPRLIRTLKHQGKSSESDSPWKEMGDAQVKVLYSLMAGKELSSKLANKFNVTNPTMTRVIDALVEKGYVERQPDPSDRRCTYLQLTGTGTEVAGHAFEQGRAALEEFLSPLSEKQLSDTRVALGHLQSLLPEGSHYVGAFCPVKSGGAGQVVQVEKVDTNSLGMEDK